MSHQITRPQDAELSFLLEKLTQLLNTTQQLTDEMLTEYTPDAIDQEHAFSLLNMLNYVAMRRQDIHALQSGLARAGLSSLGRVEPHVMNNIMAVIHLLQKAVDTCDKPATNEIQCIEYEHGYELLKIRAANLFGSAPKERSEYIMVTLPSEAADSPELIERLFLAGMNCARINCAHDSKEVWLKMIKHIRHFSEAHHTDCRVMMDLAGHKIRTGEVWCSKNKKESTKSNIKPPRVFMDEYLIMSHGKPNKKLAKEMFSVPCDVAFNSTYPPIIDKVEIGQSLWIDDGKIGTQVIDVAPEGVLLQIKQIGPKGVRLKSEKGINLPQTSLDFDTLSTKDLNDLDFICQHADLVALSFAENPNDIVYLHQKMLALGHKNLPIIAKIETPKAVKNLPKIIGHALSLNLCCGIMIARGDLAVELGSVDMAETQDAIIRLCESAHIPIIWATQVLESLAKKGSISRPEISDAAMSQRAECVMLNKGPYIDKAVEILSQVLQRMEASQFKSHTHLRTLNW